MSLQEKLEAIYKQRKQAERKTSPIIMYNVALLTKDYSKLDTKNILVM